jgi:hypothetical protein
MNAHQFSSPPTQLASSGKGTDQGSPDAVGAVKSPFQRHNSRSADHPDELSRAREVVVVPDRVCGEVSYCLLPTLGNRRGALGVAQRRKRVISLDVRPAVDSRDCLRWLGFAASLLHPCCKTRGPWAWCAGGAGPAHGARRGRPTRRVCRDRVPPGGRGPAHPRARAERDPGSAKRSGGLRRATAPNLVFGRTQY